MKYLERTIYQQFLERIKPNKVLILYGARRVGKTSIIERYLKDKDTQTYLKLNGEDVLDEKLLEQRSISNYKRLLQGKSILVIDEAQKIEDIGLKLKLIVDNIEDIKIIVTGSSQFDLQNTLGQPLVGRKITLQLLPFSNQEYSQIEDLKTTIESLETRLIYGSYPELLKLSLNREKEEYLKDLVSDYLLKDILMYDNIRNSDKLYKLLTLIALQVGQELSIPKISNELDLSRNTVDKYLDLLSKVFVIFKIGGYSKNLRKEVTKSDKWFFYDNGIRNALIYNFQPLVLRSDIGQIWENYLAYERLKYQNNNNINCKNYFWRTYDQQEIDWVEVQEGAVSAYEFKWKKKDKKTPAAWAKTYPEFPFKIINSENYLDFINPI